MAPLSNWFTYKYLRSWLPAERYRSEWSVLWGFAKKNKNGTCLWPCVTCSGGAKVSQDSQGTWKHHPSRKCKPKCPAIQYTTSATLYIIRLHQAYPGLQVFLQPYVYFPTERVGPKSVLEAQWPEPTGLEFHIIHNDSRNTYNSSKTQTQTVNEKVACNTTLSIITIKKSSRQCIWSALQGNQISWNNILYTPCHCALP